MIVKRIDINSAGFRPLKSLSEYITGADRLDMDTHRALYLDVDNQNALPLSDTPGFEPESNQERIAYWTTHQYNGEDFQDDMEEAKLVFDASDRKVSDKANTYHMLISFVPGETPDTKTMNNIEQELVESIGYDDHQRMSAVHFDRDHVHMHVAINKINPNTLKSFEPYYDKLKLIDMSSYLETKYDLEIVDHRTNHQKHNLRGFSRANDISRLSGHQTLKDWICEDVPMPDLSKMLNDPNPWQSFHAHYADHNLSYQKRGNGAVFKDIASGLHVKASAIDRSLSLATIEKVYGDFVAPAFRLDDIKPSKQYVRLPHKGFNKTLYSEYIYEGSATKKSYFVAKGQIMDSYQTQKQQAYLTYKKDSVSEASSPADFQRNTAAKIKLNIAISDIETRKTDALKFLKQEYEYTPYLKYVENLAKQGNIEALNELSTHFDHYYRKGVIPKHKGVAITGNNDDNNPQHLKALAGSASYQYVTKYGLLSFKFNDGSVIATGKGVIFVKTNNILYAESALRFAKKRFGEKIVIRGHQKAINNLKTIANSRNLGLHINHQIPGVKHNTPSATLSHKPGIDIND